jgi:hypothetical protein
MDVMRAGFAEESGIHGFDFQAAVGKAWMTAGARRAGGLAMLVVAGEAG